MKTTPGFGKWGLCTLIVLAALTAAHPRISGQAKATGAPVGEAQIATSTFLTVEAAEVRTVDQMLEAERAAGAPRGVAIPFRSTMGDAEYQQAKAMAGAAVRGPRGARPNTLAGPAAGPQLVLDGDGVDQVTAGNFFPPDTHGAIGLTQFVEVTNTHLDVYEKADLATRDLSISLNSFFGYAVPVSDPRAVYDRTWNRWVITVEAFPESSTVQLHLLAISQSPDATGPYFDHRHRKRLRAGLIQGSQDVRGGESQALQRPGLLRSALLQSVRHARSPDRPR
jgi:hypothetical protein